MQNAFHMSFGNRIGWHENTRKSLWLTWIAITSLRINQMRTISVQVDENKRNAKSNFGKFPEVGWQAGVLLTVDIIRSDW